MNAPGHDFDFIYGRWTVHNRKLRDVTDPACVDWVEFVDPPVEGRFIDGCGVFECDDEIKGRPVRIRFEWLTDDPGSPRWQQSFSYDAGRTWDLNWIMRLTRAE